MSHIYYINFSRIGFLSLLLLLIGFITVTANNNNINNVNLSVKDFNDPNKFKKPRLKELINNQTLKVERKGIAQSVPPYYQRVFYNNTPLIYVQCDKRCNLLSYKGTTSTSRKHPCIKSYFVKEEDDDNDNEDALTPSQINESKALLKDGAVQCIISDFRPFVITEGVGIRKLLKNAITVGVKLGKIPNDRDLKKLIPGRNANSNALSKDYQSYRDELSNHFAQIDKECFPAFRLSFDLWEDGANKTHYIGPMGHESDPETKEMQNYCIELMKLEDFGGDELS